MEPDSVVRRPIWPWLIALVGAVIGVGILCLQAQAMARDAERRTTPVVARPAAIAVSGDHAAAASDGESGAVPGGAGETSAPAVAAAHPGATIVVADATWTSNTAARTGIPARALSAYASAALTLQVEQPGCGLGWNTLAGLGAIESGHGGHAGGVLRDDGYPDPPIRGIALDGSASAAIPDTDGGRFDGDAVWDRAVGPLQFIPSTWEQWGADANGDGVADPNQIDDAALAAARYLCAAGEMTSPVGWRRAVFSYNHLDSYVDDVAAVANSSARLAG